MATETPGAPGRTSDALCKELHNGDRRPHTTNTKVSIGTITNDLAASSSVGVVTATELPSVNKNGRIIGDTSTITRSGEDGGQEKVPGNVTSPKGQGASTSPRKVDGDEKLDSSHADATNSDVPERSASNVGAPLMHMNMIDAAINLESDIAQSNGIDKLLHAQQSANMLPPSLDCKVTPMVQAPSLQTKLFNAPHATAYNANTNNFGITPQVPFEEQQMIPPSMLGPPSNFATNGYHTPCGVPMDVDQNSYGNLFGTSTPAPVPPLQTDFAGPSHSSTTIPHSSMTMPSSLMPTGRYNVPGTAAAPYTVPRMGEQAMFGYPMGISQRTDITPQTLMSLEDALHRSTANSSVSRDSEGDDGTPVPATVASASVAEEPKKAAPKRRKTARGGARKADETDLRVSTKKAASRSRTVRTTRLTTRPLHPLTMTKMPSNGHMSAEEKRRIRAERNRESAEKSRLRHKQRTEELERDVYNKRIENREVKASIDTYYAQLRGVADTIEKGTTREEAKKKVPALYNALSSMQTAIEQCVWTYRDPREPEIQLKINRP